jgi:hypothetical protein
MRGAPLLKKRGRPCQSPASKPCRLALVCCAARRELQLRISGANPVSPGPSGWPVVHTSPSGWPVRVSPQRRHTVFGLAFDCRFIPSRMRRKVGSACFGPSLIVVT